jgi:hypothetical protein
MIAGAVAILTLSLIALSLVDSKKLAISLGAITALFGDLMLSFSVIDKGGIKRADQAIGAVVVLVGMAAAILVLAGAVAIVGRMDPEELTRGLTGVTLMVVELALIAKMVSEKAGSFVKGAVGMVVFALALTTLSLAVKIYGRMDPKELEQGLKAVGALLAGLSLFMMTAKMDRISIKGALGLIVIAGVMALLSRVVANFGGMEQDKLQQGLQTMGALAAGISAFSNSLRGANPQTVIASAVGFAIISGSLLIMAEVIKTLGNLDIEILKKGLGAVAAALIGVAIAANMMPKDMLLKGAGILLVSAGLYIIAEAMAKLANLTSDQIFKSLLALGGVLLVITVAMQFMTTALPGAAALLIISGALMLLVPAMEKLGQMSLKQIGTALLAMVGLFTVLGLAGLILTPVVPTLIALGGAMLLMGLGAAAFGAGIGAFAVGMATLMAGGAASIMFMQTFLKMLTETLPALG